MRYEVGWRLWKSLKKMLTLLATNTEIETACFMVLASSTVSQTRCCEAEGGCGGGVKEKRWFQRNHKGGSSASGATCALNTLHEMSRSLIESKLCEALSFLRNDGKSILGIWGMGATLLKQINNALAEDPSSLGFDRVVFVTASREWTIEKIQKLISKELGLREEGNHSNDIFNYLRNRGFVILLDDLWRRLDLKDVGVPPLGTVGNCKRKLILTTRDRQVCWDMEADPTIRVDCLSDEVARLLFRAKIGEETINSHPLIPDLADKVADECGGLPKEYQQRRRWKKNISIPSQLLGNYRCTMYQN